MLFIDKNFIYSTVQLNLVFGSDIMEYREDYHSSVLIIGPNNQVVLICDEKKWPRLWKFPGGKKEFDEDPSYSRYYFCSFVDSFLGRVELSEEKERTGIFDLSELDSMPDFLDTYRGFYRKIKEAGLLPV